MPWAQHTKLNQSFTSQTAADGSGGALGGHLVQPPAQAWRAPTAGALFLSLDRWGAARVLCSPSAQLHAN